MLPISVIIGNRPRSAYRKNEMCKGLYDYERLLREGVPHGSYPSDGYHKIVNTGPPLLNGPGEENYNRYYSYVDYREHEVCTFSLDGTSSPPHRGDESGYKWTRDDNSASSQNGYVS
uniref:Uncharacterized protein n=1 Tax=Rhinolophus ferrumequinum TaxID=59479 RepID=A0A671DL78_RHIFE